MWNAHRATGMIGLKCAWYIAVYRPNPCVGRNLGARGPVGRLLIQIECFSFFKPRSRNGAETDYLDGSSGA
jgi:hypothetical protein